MKYSFGLGLAVTMIVNASAMGQSVALESRLANDVRGVARISSVAGSASGVDRTLARDAVRRAPAAGSSLDRARQVLSNPRTRGAAVGNFAEGQFLRDNPSWNRVSKPNAPQNDVYRWRNGRFEGGQIKTHSPLRSSTYASDMLKDHRAERFFVPDDHLDVVRRDIDRHIGSERARAARLRTWGDEHGALRHERKAAQWGHHRDRLAPLGRTYAELDGAVTKAAKGVCRRAAGTAGVLGGAAVVVLDSTGVVYSSLNGQLTPHETQVALAGTAVKGAAVGSAVGTAVILGANPVGLPVIVVGAATYFVVDYATTIVQDHYASTPLTREQIKSLMSQARTASHPMSSRPG